MYNKEDMDEEFLKDELKGIDLCNHGIKHPKYDKGIASMDAEEVLTMQANKYK